MAAPDPTDLVEITSGLPELGSTVLLHAFDGFVDAGSAVSAVCQHLTADDAGTVVARFDVDQLVDHRARRPVLRLDGDHWASYEPHDLVVRLLHDRNEVPYLLLAGPEPDLQWERFVAAVRVVVDRLGVRLCVGLHAVPFAIPHTRPARVILNSLRADLREGSDPQVGQVMVPASIGPLLEYRLGALGYDMLGIAMPVPAYLAQTAYPTAAAALLREVETRTGLQFDLTGLDDAAAQARVAIDAQIAESDQAREMVSSLENQYDSFARGQAESLLADGSLPTADELGAELERFLAENRGQDDPPAS